MSGGAFDYNQSMLKYIIESLEGYISSGVYWEESEDKIPDDVIEDMKTAIKHLGIAYVYVQRLDWLISGGDSEDTYRQRLAGDLANLNKIT